MSPAETVGSQRRALAAILAGALVVVAMVAAAAALATTPTTTLASKDFEAKDMVETWRRPLKLEDKRPVKLQAKGHPHSLEEPPRHSQMLVGKTTGKTAAGKTAGKTTPRPPTITANDILGKPAVSQGYNNWLDRLPFGNEYQQRLRRKKEEAEKMKYNQQHDPAYLLNQAGALNTLLSNRVKFLKRMLKKRMAQPASMIVNVERPGLPGAAVHSALVAFPAAKASLVPPARKASQATPVFPGRLGLLARSARVDPLASPDPLAIQAVGAPKAAPVSSAAVDSVALAAHAALLPRAVVAAVAVPAVPR
eukprot:CAMPEP_0117013472 /NCGR_PEP_ID=MMETSP0472-20121206/11110_1 /TAXON_ID=693140 ORGANISM="Tiarina fusus, Strain LIS" /NCGR_SAMPLE_ID=MMETSP0472 /ASSEMBLY_ACC=CAM_ASM_000603 /LENGTH=307 /DNA_ID=CAMNT_0004716791 /DNA_START=33 /DNA_END=953 /DNA_ORIENTATION=+